jgi:integrase
MRILTEDEILALAEAMPPRYRTLVLTKAGYTGLRIGELAGLRVRHVGFPRRILAVEETLTDQGHIQFGPPKAGRRTISVPASIVDELCLARHRVRRRQRASPRCPDLHRRPWRAAAAEELSAPGVAEGGQGIWRPPLPPPRPPLLARVDPH